MIFYSIYCRNFALFQFLLVDVARICQHFSVLAEGFRPKLVGPPSHGNFYAAVSRVP